MGLFRENAADPIIPSGPAPRRPLSPFALALVGVFSGTALTLCGAALERIAPWTHGVPTGLFCGLSVCIVCCVEALRRGGA